MSELDQIIKILIRKSAAVVKKSAEDLNELLDSKFVYLDSRGNRANKRQYIEHCCKIGKMKLINQRFGHIDIQDFNSFAIATMILFMKNLLIKEKSFMRDLNPCMYFERLIMVGYGLRGRQCQFDKLFKISFLWFELFDLDFSKRVTCPFCPMGEGSHDLLKVS